MIHAPSSCKTPIYYICLQAAESECYTVWVWLFPSPSVFRHFGSMKSKHPGGRVAVLCWDSTMLALNEQDKGVREKQPNGFTPGSGMQRDVVHVRQRNDWIIEEFTTQWDIAALVKAGNCCYKNDAIKIKAHYRLPGYHKSYGSFWVSSLQNRPLL